MNTGVGVFISVLRGAFRMCSDVGLRGFARNVCDMYCPG